MTEKVQIYLYSFSEGGKTGSMSSGYITCGHLVDPADDSIPEHPENEDITRDETTKSLRSFPPEGYFCQPIVEELGRVIHETSALTCLPSSHYHPHDYGMVDKNNVLLIVGEAKSGNCDECEHDKVLTGLGHCLSVYNSGISFISSWNESLITLADIRLKFTTKGRQILILARHTVKVEVDNYEEDYHIYVDKVLNVLESASIAFMDNNDNWKVKPTNHLAVNPSNTVTQNDYNKRIKIDLPGVYMGVNPGFVIHEAPGLYIPYILGWMNHGLVYRMEETHYGPLVEALNTLRDQVQEQKQTTSTSQDTTIQIQIPGTVANREETQLVVLDNQVDTCGEFPYISLATSDSKIPCRNVKFYTKLPPDYEPYNSDENRKKKPNLGKVVL